jgi:hypothetical protein
MNTDEKLKILADLVLNNWERLDAVLKIVSTLMENAMDQGATYNVPNNKMRSDLEQLQGFLQSSIATRASLEKLFNL